MAEHTAEIDTPRAWLMRPCPACGVGPYYACRDEDGHLGNPHDARVIPPETTERRLS